MPNRMPFLIGDLPRLGRGTSTADELLWILVTSPSGGHHPCCLACSTATMGVPLLASAEWFQPKSAAPLFLPVTSRVCRRYFTCDSTNGIGDHGCVAALPATRVGPPRLGLVSDDAEASNFARRLQPTSKPPPVNVMA
ncbi:hypothetical protein MRX96_014197 [Rhipicephalus microplus]